MALTRLPSFTLLGTDSYTFGNANVSGNVTTGNLKTDHLLYANGDPYIFTTNAAGTNTQVQFNDGNSFSGDANLTFNKATGTLTAGYFVGNGSQLTGLPAGYANSNVESYLPAYTGNLSPGNLTVTNKTVLGNVVNVAITGGVSNQLLQTDGLGNLSWVTPTGTTINVDNFTANGVQTDFTLSVTPASKVYTMLAIAGVMQPRSVYSLTGNVITFSSAPPNTAPIEVTTFSSVIGYGTSDIVANSFTANVLTATIFNSNTASANTLTANTLSGNIISSTANLAVNTLSANSITNTGTGIPTINSATSINFTASTVVRTTSSPFQFYNCTSTVRDTIAASNGYVIYNTTTNKLQVYANGTWVDLH